MIRITERAVIASPLEGCWLLLRDPARVASCIPGAQVTGVAEDGRWLGTIAFKFGPTLAVFRGEARLLYDDEAHRCEIDARGADQRGASRANARFVIHAQAMPGSDDRTQLDVEGGFEVNGPIAVFANAGGVHLARAMLAQFAANLSGALGHAAASSPRAPPASALQLVVDAILAWWKARRTTPGEGKS